MSKLPAPRIICDFLGNSARAFPEKVGLIFENREYKYGEIKKKADNFSSFLVSRTNKGDVVALLLPNIPEMIFSYFGILESGCIALLLPANISDKNLIFQIAKTRPKFIVSQEKYKDKLFRVGLRGKIDFIDAENFPLHKNNFKRDIQRNDISSIIFTSGATGIPKGARLQHSNAVCATKNIIDFLKWNENDIDVNILPLSHSFGLGNIHCVFSVAGQVILFRDSINLKDIMQTIKIRKATTFAAVPATLRLIVDNYLKHLRECSSLRFIQTNTSLLEEELIKKVISALPNSDFNYYYGLTEASRSTFITLNRNLNKIRSVGRPSPNVKIKIISKKGSALSANEIGEICIKGGHVVKGYWENPDASKKIKNGWLHTGDTGYLDEDGYVYFKGREDDVINVGGEKVSPEEIEEIARKIPGIKEAAAIGVPDKLLGEAVKLFICTERKGLDVQEVIQECRRKLESYKQPRSVKIILNMPRTENGKIARYKLKQYER